MVETVNKAASTAAVTTSLNPSTYGSNLTLTAAITPAHGGAVTGTITFKDGSTSIGTASVSSATNKASLATHVLAGGAHQITVSYGGSADVVASVSPVLTETINKATATTAITSSLNPSTFGGAVTFTAKVTSASGASPSGEVHFKSSGTLIGVGTLNATTHLATFTMSTLIAGPHQISATYAGDTNYAIGSSPVVTQNVNKAPTTTTLASSLNPSTHGTSVTFTATIASSVAGNVTGTVTFKNGSTSLGTGTVNSTTHKATFSTSALAVGTDSITASYGGNSNFNASNSTALSQVVH
jgi:hypothetical protein